MAESAIERHSIDWVPDDERHGEVSGLGAVWFVANINLTAMATGTAALSVGASLFWTIMAAVLGSLFGTFFMAFHSAQGPHLGLPQLVQSRPQFGYAGAALTVWIFALVNYIAYNTSDAILAGAAMRSLLGLGANAGYVIAAAAAAVIALYGYRWIHRINWWLTWPLIVLMAVLTVAAFTDGALPPDAFRPGTFRVAPCMTVFVITAGFQLGWAPYVSDYSRYLPTGTEVRSTFWWTYLPSALSGGWVFVLGAVTASAAPGADPVAAVEASADRLVGGFGPIAVAMLLVGLLSVMTINQYGGSLTMISISDSIRTVSPTRRIRALTIGLMFLVVWGVSQIVGVARFNAFYANVLIFLAYLFTPWTAINLMDYFVVRRGTYVVTEMFNPRGIYGRWGWRANLAYLAAISAMAPFMVSGPYTGPLARVLGGVDYSIFIGLSVAATLYWVLSRTLDLDAERELAREEGILELPH